MQCAQYGVYSENDDDDGSQSNSAACRQAYFLLEYSRVKELSTHFEVKHRLFNFVARDL